MKFLLIMAGVVGVVLVAGIVWMLGPGGRWVLENLDGVPVGGPTGLSGKDLAAALDAVRGRTMAVATGLAALLAVFYTARNADTARRMFQLGEHGHVTDRYGKAVEQLGSREAPVRLGGLYALEQLAQETPSLRQTIVDVICAYLRMPYTPPTQQDRHEKIRATQRAARGSGVGRARTANGRDPHEERQVRLTAQRILAAHLRPNPQPSQRWWQLSKAKANQQYWPNIQLDLSGATLVDLHFTGCRFGDVDFTGATFIGETWFTDATFTGRADFDDATFEYAGFAGAKFPNSVRFNSAMIENANFNQATFPHDTRFYMTTFTDVAMFVAATFTGRAQFANATFRDTAWFGGGTFLQGDLPGATFSGPAMFQEVTFEGVAWFGEVTFTGDVEFTDATFADTAGWEGATGLETAELDGVRVLPLSIQQKQERQWPAAWREVPDGNGGWTLRLAAEMTVGSPTTENDAAPKDGNDDTGGAEGEAARSPQPSG